MAMLADAVWPLLVLQEVALAKSFPLSLTWLGGLELAQLRQERENIKNNYIDSLRDGSGKLPVLTEATG